MKGYICDVCGTFSPHTRVPAATYEHRALLVDDDGRDINDGKRVQIEADFCDDCAIDLSRRLRIYPGQEDADATP